MKKKFTPKEFEEKIYNYWEKNGYFSPKRGKPFTILMPPPNANDPLHAGHGMYVVEDILIRWRRLQGYASLWIPGTDHAGFETQYVFEKYLSKKGKSRLDYDRRTLYKKIYDYVSKNKSNIISQLRRLGFLADWDRGVFTLDRHVVKQVYKTFKKMQKENLLYRDDYIVNYCVHCGTSLAELEVKHVERADPLYYIKYTLADSSEYIVVATVRPETIFVDTHLAINPKDKKNKKYIGMKVVNALTNHEMEIIGDAYADPEFGTGIVKLTPAHDPNDFEIAKKRSIPIIQAIGWNGKITEAGGEYAGMKVKDAKKKIVDDLHKKERIEKIDNNYVHNAVVCYKCGHDLEPLTIPNWFIKVEKLKKPVIKAVGEDRVKFYPKRYKKQMLDWLEVMHDWPISRQIVWGIRIPVWYKVEKSKDNIFVWWIDKKGKQHHGSLISQFIQNGVALSEIKDGLQKIYALTGRSAPEYVISEKSPGDSFLPETDTFDTWFSSGQWPLVTLKDHEYKNRFPTDFMGTLSDILKFWISRMILFSLYLKNDIPFKDVYLWSMVTDKKGIKMSKSKGNVVNPIAMIDTYGADAFRASLMFGISQGGRSVMSEDKIRGMRNFANKIWNIGRFLKMQKSAKLQAKSYISQKNKKIVGQLEKEFKETKESVIINMNSYRFSRALDDLYEFIWHRFADYYIEALKDELRSGNIRALDRMLEVYLGTLKLLHPFVPFVTEVVWKEFCGENKSILDVKLEA